MIVFDLHCGRGHTFEEWFASRTEYDDRVSAHDIVCPECGDKDVAKGLSAPRINGSSDAAAPAVGPCGMPGMPCAGGMCPSAMPD